MSESKTYIFGENQNGGSNGMLGLLAPLLQKQGVDPKGEDVCYLMGSLMQAVYLFYI